MAQIFEMKNYKTKGSHEISTLIASILQPAMAGGISEKRAEEIYNEIMSNIASLGKDKEGNTAFQTLLDDILRKWYPMANK
jgi:hypothetical protein